MGEAPVVPEESASATDVGSRQIRLRYAGRCHRCGAELPPRTEALHFPQLKKVACLACPDTEETEAAARAPLDRGRAGLGAQREYERRRARDEARTRKKWGRFGGIAVALSQEKRSTTAWAIGAEGERRIGARLDRVAEELGGTVLHDRRIPGSRANIDHILIVPSGVWVIDAKRYKGKVEIRRSGGFLTPLLEKLTVRGHDCTSLVKQSLRQVELVREVTPAAPVTGVLCFEGAEWPLGGHLRTRGIQILWPRRVKRLAGRRRSPSIDVDVISAQLAAHFCAAQ